MNRRLSMYVLMNPTTNCCTYIHMTRKTRSCVYDHHVTHILRVFSVGRKMQIDHYGFIITVWFSKTNLGLIFTVCWRLKELYLRPYRIFICQANEWSFPCVSASYFFFRVETYYWKILIENNRVKSRRCLQTIGRKSIEMLRWFVDF